MINGFIQEQTQFSCAMKMNNIWMKRHNVTEHFFCSFFGIWSLDMYRRYAIEKETEEQLFKQKIMTHGIPIKLSQEAKEDLVRMIQAILEKK